MTHGLDPVLGQQRLPFRGGEEPLTATVQHAMGEQNPRPGQPVVRCVEQGHINLVGGVVPGPGDEVVQTDSGLIILGAVALYGMS